MTFFLDLEMPYIVRLFLQKKHEIETNQGSECSGTIIDNHWIATSFVCCEDIVAFRLINFGRNRMRKVDQGQGSTDRKVGRNQAIRSQCADP